LGSEIHAAILATVSRSARGIARSIATVLSLASLGACQEIASSPPLDDAAAHGGTGASGGAASGGTSGGVGGSGGNSGGAGGSSGGSGGSGGSSGALGSAGEAGSGGASGPCGAAGLIVCDDFDLSAAAGPPSTTNWQPQPDWQSERILIDATKSVSGPNSVSLVGTTYGVELVRSVGLPPPDNTFYVRVRMQLEKSTGDMGGHIAFIEGAEAEDDSGEELRFGASHGMLDLNVQPGTKGSGGGEKTQFSNGDVDVPSSGAPGVVLEANRWYCIEALFDGKNHEFRLWVDGSEIAGLHVSDWKQGRSGWSPSYAFVKIGAQNFSGSTGRVFYDDVAIGTSPIGC
jgi:hypothetical protein